MTTQGSGGYMTTQGSGGYMTTQGSGGYMKRISRLYDKDPEASLGTGKKA